MANLSLGSPTDVEMRQQVGDENQEDEDEGTRPRQVLLRTEGDGREVVDQNGEAGDRLAKVLRPKG